MGCLGAGPQGSATHQRCATGATCVTTRHSILRSKRKRAIQTDFLTVSLPHRDRLGFHLSSSRLGTSYVTAGGRESGARRDGSFWR